MASSGDRLTPLQEELLQAFFEQEAGFFLTGGAALVGFHLGHRHTDDLDLFTMDEEAFERGSFALQAAADATGARLTLRQQAPGFRRYVAERPDDAVVVDLVLERVPQMFGDKESRGRIVIDSPREILANKLTALVSRAEERDLIDVMVLERAGYPVEDALPAALAKDGACTPATLSWVLSQITIPSAARLPGGVAAAELRSYLDDLIRRLRRAAAPTG